MDTVERIFYLLNEKKMEQKEFASKIGVSENVVSTWRTGRTKSYSRYLSKIAEVLNTTPEYLLTGQERQKEITGNPTWDAAKELFVRLTLEEQLEYIADMAKKVGEK